MGGPKCIKRRKFHQRSRTSHMWNTAKRKWTSIKTKKLEITITTTGTTATTRRVSHTRIFRGTRMGKTVTREVGAITTRPVELAAVRKAVGGNAFYLVFLFYNCLSISSRHPILLVSVIIPVLRNLLFRQRQNKFRIFRIIHFF